MKGKICGLLAGCVLLAGCAGVPGTSAAQTATAESAPASVPAATAETSGKSLTVVLNGCIAYEVDSAGGSLKTAIAAADLVVLPGGRGCARRSGRGDRRLAGQPGRRQPGHAGRQLAGGVRLCRGHLPGPGQPAGAAGRRRVTTDFSAMDLTEVPEQLGRA